MFLTVSPPDPPDALLLATATMSPTQRRVRPVMTATRRPCTLFMLIPTLILTQSPLRCVSLGVNTLSAPDQTKTCFVSSGEITLLCQILFRHHFWKSIFTYYNCHVWWSGSIVQSMSMTDKLVPEVSRCVTLALQKSVSSTLCLWRRLWPDVSGLCLSGRGSRPIPVLPNVASGPINISIM